MNRDEFMELVYETFADEPDNVLANGIIEAADAYVEHEKAQLSQQGTTSDLISRTETVEHLRRVLGATVPISDYDEGFVDGVEFGVSTVSTMPSVQPQSTAGQLNDSAQSTNLIDRQETIDRFNVIRPVDPKKDEYTKGIDVGIAMCIVAVKDQPTIPPVATDTNVGDTISRQQAIDALNEYFARIGKLKRRGLTEGEKAISLDTVGTIKTLPSVQPEPKEGHWIPHESPDGSEQYECSRCGVLWEFNDGTPEDNEAYFCPKCGAKMKGARSK